MRIGIFTDQYLPNMSGMVTSIINLRAGLEELGHEVYIVAPAARGYQDDDNKIIRVMSVDPRVFMGNAMAIPTRGILKKLVRMQFDVVHVHEMFFIGALGHAVAKQSGSPLVATIHTQWDKLFRHYPTTVVAAAVGTGIGYPLYFGLRNTLSTYINAGEERNILAKQFGRNLLIFANECDAVIVPSVHVMERMQRLRCKTHLFHLPNGIKPQSVTGELRLPAVSKNSMKFVCVGRVSREKRTLKLIEAFAGLKRSNAELFVIGDGPEKLSCIEYVDKMGISNTVHIMGSLSNEETRDLIADADVLVIASHGFDNQPMVILEALSAGKAILYCDPQLRDGLSDLNALLVPHTVNGLAQGIMTLSGSGRLVAKMGKASKAIAKEYNYKKITKSTVQIYKQCQKEFTKVTN